MGGQHRKITTTEGKRLHWRNISITLKMARQEFWVLWPVNGSRDLGFLPEWPSTNGVEHESWGISRIDNILRDIVYVRTGSLTGLAALPIRRRGFL